MNERVYVSLTTDSASRLRGSKIDLAVEYLKAYSKKEDTPLAPPTLSTLPPPSLPAPRPIPPSTCKCGRTISRNRRFCLRCLSSFQRMVDDGFCPSCASKILDHHLHPSTGPEYYDWLLRMLQDGKDAETGHKLGCPNYSLNIRSNQPIPQVENTR